MDWFRKNLQMGSRLALFALAIQFVLSFSHVHLDGFIRVASQPAYAATSNDDGQAPGSPTADHDPFCAVCASIQLASCLICPDSPALALPAFSLVRPKTFLARSIAAAPRPHFNARAPPVV